MFCGTHSTRRRGRWDQLQKKEAEVERLQARLEAAAAATEATRAYFYATMEKSGMPRILQLTDSNQSLPIPLTSPSANVIK